MSDIEEIETRVQSAFAKNFDGLRVVDSFYDTSHPKKAGFYHKEGVVVLWEGHRVRVEWVAELTEEHPAGVMCHWRVMYGERERMVFVRGEGNKGQMVEALNYVTGNPFNNALGFLGLTKLLCPVLSQFEEDQLYQSLGNIGLFLH